MSESTPREQTDNPLTTRQFTAYQRLVQHTIPPSQEDEEGSEVVRKVRLSLLALGLSCHASRLSAALLSSVFDQQEPCLEKTRDLHELVRFHLGNVLWHMAAIFSLKRLALDEFYGYGQCSPDDGRLLRQAVVERAGDQSQQLHLLARFLVGPPFATLDILLRSHNRDRKDAWISSGVRMMGIVRVCADAFDLSLEEIMAYNLQVLKGEREVGGSVYFQQNVLDAGDGLPLDG